MSEKKRSIATGARLTLAGVVVAASIGAIAAASAVTLPTVQATRPAVTAMPEAGTATVGCTAPFIALGRTFNDAQALAVAAEPAYLVANGSAHVEKHNGTIDGIDGSESTAFSAEPDGDTRANFAVAASVTVDSPDLAGFAPFACQPGLMQSYLVGGDTITGSTGVLSLSNPGDVPATVDITVFGVGGPVVPPGASGIVVAAGSTVLVPYAGIVGDEMTPVLRIDSHGTPVQASLQSGIVRTLVTGGVDVHSAIPAAQTTQVVPGIVVQDGQMSGQDVARLRVLATHEAATATVVLTKVGSTQPVYTTEVPLEGGIPQGIDIPQLAAGTYVATVTATSEIVAAVWSTSGYQAGSDYEWSAAAPLIGAEVPFGVPDGSSPTLSLVNSQASEATVTVETAGSPTTYTLAPGESVAVDVAPTSTGTLTVTSGAVHAAVSFDGKDAIGSFPLWPADAAASPVVVSR